MKSFRILLLMVAGVIITACGNGTETQQSQEKAVANEAPASPAPVSDAETAEAVDTEPATVEVVEESSAEEVVKDSEEIVLAKTESPDPASATIEEWKFSEGKHFTVLTTAQGTSSPLAKIEVAEVFWYGCPHCFNFDPYVEKWRETLPDDVSFVRVPVIWNPTNELHARIFYTAEALDKGDVMHEAVFREMHLNKKTLSTEDEIRDFFIQYGVSEDEFNNTFRSFGVESKLKRAKNLTQRYRIQSVPLLVVNGKYVTTGPEIKTFEDILAVTDELVEREQQEY